MKPLTYFKLIYHEGSVMKNFQKIIFGIIFCLSLSANVYSQNFNDALRLSEPGIITGARSLAMGNAFIALSDDFSASLFNPAGLGLIKNMELSGGMNYNSFDNNAGFFNQSTKSTNDIKKLSQIGVVLPFPTIQGSFVVSIGYNQVKDFNKVVSFNGFNSGNNSYIQDLTSYNDDIAFKLALSYPIYDSQKNYIKDVTVINGQLNQRGKIVQDGGINSWSFSGAVEIQQNLFVGATINIYNGTLHKTNEYSEEDLKNIYPSTLLLDPIDPGTADFKSFYIRDIIDWDLSGVGLKLGALLKMNEKINLGATIKLPTKFTIKETYSITSNSVFGTGDRFSYVPEAERLEYEISSPAEFSAGASYLRNNLLLSGNVTMIDYSTMKFESGLDRNASADKNADIVDLMRSVWNLNGGFEYLLKNSKIALRGGVMLMPSPFKDDPKEFDKKFITVGMGYNFSKSSSLNFAYVYGWWKDVGDNYGSNISRTFQDVKFHNIVTSVKFNL